MASSLLSEAMLIFRSAGAGGETASSTLTDRLRGCGSGCSAPPEEEDRGSDLLLDTAASDESSSLSSTTLGSLSSSDEEFELAEVESLRGLLTGSPLCELNLASEEDSSPLDSSRLLLVCISLSDMMITVRRRLLN